MKILIIGAGKVGLAIARQLTNEGHDIAVVDSNAEKIAQVSDMYDVITLEGSGTNFSVLREAGVQDSDLVIAATGSDDINMVVSVAASHLGATYVAARMKDPEYNSERAFLREAYGMSAVFNPDLGAASEISRILQFPTAARVETFARGRAELVEYRIPSGSSMDGLALKDLAKTFKARVLVCAVERGGVVSIPKGDFVLRCGDRLNISGARPELRRFFAAVGAYKKPVRSAMLLGGSRIAGYLARNLIDAGIRVTIIERRRERCEMLFDLLPEASIVCGDGCKQEVLLEEGIRDADAFVALTGFDEDNIIVSMYAQDCGVGKVVTKISDDHFVPMLQRSGLDCFICPKVLAASEIVRYARAIQNAEGSSVETLYRLNDDKVEALEFVVGAGSRCVERPLKDLRLREHVLIAAVIHGNECIIPNGNTVIHPGDRAVVVTTGAGLRDLDAILE
ncbi:MAG: Trk system potassium transporter TrkA [Oscillospiraceae bacterium]|nr:Trk system potassium transporter TrkA [Oscillospiraceae bacterium]